MKKINSITNTNSLDQTGSGYLKIIFIIFFILILLLSVLILSQFEGVTQIFVSPDQTGNLIEKGGIIVTDSMTSSSGDAIISLQNNSGKELKILKIYPINDLGFRGEDNLCLNILNDKEKTDCFLSNINYLCPCEKNQTVTCNYKINYISNNNIEQTEQFKLTNTCTEETPKVYDLTVNVVPTEAATVIGEGKYKEGTTINIIATANNGYNCGTWGLPEGIDVMESDSGPYPGMINPNSNMTYTMPAKPTTITINCRKIITQTDPTDLKYCDTNSDCVKVDAKFEFNDGKMIMSSGCFDSINKKYLSYWENKEKINCDKVECDCKAYSFPTVSCINYKCEYIRGEDPADLRECNIDPDCTQVDVKSCCKNYEVINKKYTEYWLNRESDCQVEDVMCPSVILDKYINPTPKCESKTCIITGEIEGIIEISQ